MSETASKRKRSSLRAMADYAFDRAYKLRIRSANLSKSEAWEARVKADRAEAMMLEDICHFLDAIRELKGPVKDEIRKQIAETQQRKAAQEKLNSVEMHSGQDRA